MGAACHAKNKAQINSLYVLWMYILFSFVHVKQESERHSVARVPSYLLNPVLTA
jgi:hypothetical protein